MPQRTHFARPALATALAAAMSSVAAAPAFAQSSDPVAPPKAGRFSAGLGATGEFLLSSTSLQDFQFNGNLSQILDTLPDVEGIAQINEQSLDNSYGSLVGVQGTVSYGLTDRIELFARGGYMESGSSNKTAGSFAGGDTQGTFTAVLDDYNEFYLHGGARYFFNDGMDFRPFVGGFFGVRFIDSVGMTLTADGNAGPIGTVYDGALFDDDTVLTAGGEFGLAYSFRDNFTFSVNVGISWTGEWSLAEEAFEGTVLNGAQDTGRRLSIPIGGRFTYTF
ncbi:hypothetical protein EV659_10937 [Rhodothalassium salexigens DSM 2132]|uniref:Outer membrane protein with beta-barrel domain n=1 Tax=Rhodothalassium salexigens DSM 2132 TaxID=1188247 RepID=A0A4R2PF27_RHOSA|nr:hypothetical protein [Rhodothalassium salexigens]MBB4212304.1 hypothetical protein [Rhodothalassium salexigens DSM 2132]MBK1638805.1 hypothetical protein [Rhodothalassium salexigens DSM 2132]TCP32545.1 hypothetical protein EV659_10937 [Rhodothalassium salexigens DSM 2132]